MKNVFSSSGAAFVAHLAGALTCASCWAIFGPSLAVLFGSSALAAMETMRPYAPIAIAVSGAGLVYSVISLVRRRNESRGPAFRMAATFTVLSVIGWTFSAVFVAVTVVKG